MLLRNHYTLDELVPIASQQNCDVSEKLREVIRTKNLDDYTIIILREAIARLDLSPEDRREPFGFTYKFTAGDLVEMKRQFSPRWGTVLEGDWKLMLITGLKTTETNCAMYYALPVQNVGEAKSHHYWEVYERDLRIPLNPKDD